MDKPFYFYICTKCGKERRSTYPGKKVCLLCNLKAKSSRKPKGFFGIAFNILKVKSK